MVIEADEDAEAIARALDAALDARKRAENDVGNLRGQLQLMLKDSGELRGSGWRASYVARKGTIDAERAIHEWKIDAKAMEQYRRTPTRSFTFWQTKRGKEEE